MAEIIKAIGRGTPLYIRITFIICIILGIVGFILPPTGVIDSSVLHFIAIIIGMGGFIELIYNLPRIIQTGVRAKLQVGGEKGVNIEVEKRKKEIEEEIIEEGEIE